MDRIKVFIVEDDPFWVKLMSDLVNKESDMFIVGIANNGEDAFHLTKNLNIDVILMDINLADNNYDGISTTLELNQNQSLKVIMLTSYEEEEIIKDSFIAGAVNFIPKKRYKDIPDAIRLTFSNTSPIEVLLQEFAKLKKEEQLKELTPSEREVYELMEQGYSQSEMGEKLFKTENTIKKQITQILRKIGVRTSKEAVRRVKSKGLYKK